MAVRYASARFGLDDTALFRGDGRPVDKLVVKIIHVRYVPFGWLTASQERRSLVANRLSMFDSPSFGFCAQQSNCADANKGNERNEEVRNRYAASSEDEGHDKRSHRPTEETADAFKEANPGLAYAGRVLLGAINLDHGIDADAKECQDDPTRERKYGIV